MKEPTRLADHETELVGQWLTRTQKIVADPTAQRIEWLVSQVLVLLGTEASGGVELYRDPETGRLWERSCPQTGVPGGGPPRLARIETEAARIKYGAIADG